MDNINSIFGIICFFCECKRAQVAHPPDFSVSHVHVWLHSLTVQTDSSVYINNVIPCSQALSCKWTRSLITQCQLPSLTFVLVLLFKIWGTLSIVALAQARLLLGLRTTESLQGQKDPLLGIVKLRSKDLLKLHNSRSQFTIRQTDDVTSLSIFQPRLLPLWYSIPHRTLIDVWLGVFEWPELTQKLYQCAAGLSYIENRRDTTCMSQTPVWKTF